MNLTERTKGDAQNDSSALLPCNEERSRYPIALSVSTSRGVASHMPREAVMRRFGFGQHTDTGKL